MAPHLARGSFRARVEGKELVRSPLAGRPCVFAVVELWSGDEPGGALRRIARMVLGDVVRLVGEDGARADVLVRRADLTFGAPPALEVTSERALPPEIVALLTTTRARVTAALSIGEHVVRAGASVLATPPTAGEAWILADIQDAVEV